MSPFPSRERDSSADLGVEVLRDHYRESREAMKEVRDDISTMKGTLIRIESTVSGELQKMRSDHKDLRARFDTLETKVDEQSRRIEKADADLGQIRPVAMSYQSIVQQATGAVKATKVWYGVLGALLGGGITIGSTNFVLKSSPAEPRRAEPQVIVLALPASDASPDGSR